MSDQSGLLTRVVTTGRLYEEVAAAGGGRCMHRCCVAFGASIFACCIYFTIIGEGVAAHKEFVANELANKTQLVKCDLKGHELLELAGNVFLQNCEVKAKKPVSAIVPGFTEVLKDYSTERALWVEMDVYYNSRRRGGWTQTNQEGSLEAFVHVAEDLTMGPYKVNDDTVELFPGYDLPLEQTRWQAEGKDMPHVDQDWLNWTFNESTMWTQCSDGTCWGLEEGNTRVKFLAAWEGKYSVLGGVHENFENVAELGFVQSNDDWIHNIFLAQPGNAAFEDMLQQYKTDAAGDVVLTRFKVFWILSYGIWVALWPSSSIACCTNFAKKKCDMPGCCDARGASTILRALVMGACVTFLASWGSCHFFYDGPTVALAAMIGSFALLLVIDSIPRICHCVQMQLFGQESESDDNSNSSDVEEHPDFFAGICYKDPEQEEWE